MVCPVYTELRLQLFHKSILISNFETSSDTDNFVSLVKSSQKYVAQFVDAAYQRRRNILYTWHVHIYIYILRTVATRHNISMKI